MPGGDIVVERRPPLAVLTLSQPGRRNALHQALWDLLARRLDELAQEPPRVLVLTGAGGHFSTGADLAPDNPMIARIAPAFRRGEREPALKLLRELKAVVDRLAAFPAPTLAAIEGDCVGGGLEIALACDLRVAARDARLGFPELRVGFIPDIGGTVRLTRLLGPGRAAELILSSRLLSGEEAARLGLVERLAGPGEALGAALALAGEIARAGPVASREALRVIRAVPELSLEQAMELENEAGATAMCSGEVAEGLAAFAEKRSPRWTEPA